MAVCGFVSWIWGWAMSSTSEHLLVSRGGPEAGHLGVTAGVHPKGDTVRSVLSTLYLSCLFTSGTRPSSATV